MKIIAQLLLPLLVSTALVLSGPAEALTDPTRPWTADSYAGKSGSQASSGWTLNSVLVSPDRRIAIINGQYVSEGETIGTARIISIRKSDVLLQQDGKRIRLRLIPDIVRKHP